MSTSVLPQLLEVDAELLAQSSSLEAQLNELQEKRKGIQTVIAMFESGGNPEAAKLAAAAVSTPAKKVAAKRGPKAKATKTATKAKATKAKATKATKAKATKATKAKTTKTAAKAKAKTAKTATKTTKVKATRGRPAKAKATASKASGKRSGRTANWQRFVQENYSKAPLPDVIVGILQAQPSNVFKIADVMTAVFKEDMPRAYLL